MLEHKLVLDEKSDKRLKFSCLKNSYSDKFFHVKSLSPISRERHGIRSVSYEKFDKFSKSLTQENPYVDSLPETFPVLFSCLAIPELKLNDEKIAKTFWIS